MTEQRLTERQAAAAERRRRRLQAAEAEAAGTTEAAADAAAALALFDTADGAAALRRLQRIADAEARRLPVALRAAADGADAAADALLRLAGSEDGRRSLAAAVKPAASAARTLAERRYRQAVRSIIGGRVRRGTTAEAAVTADALADAGNGPLRFRAGAEAERVQAALQADGRWQQADRDFQRSYALAADAAAGWQAGKAAADAAGIGREAVAADAERLAVKRGARRFGAVREATTNAPPAGTFGKHGSVRLIREQSLETMLTEALRGGGAPSGAMATDTAGRTLAGMAADADWRRSFTAAWREALQAEALRETGRGAALLRTATLALAAASVRDCSLQAVRWHAEALRLRTLADALAERSAALRTDGAADAADALAAAARTFSRLDPGLAAADAALAVTLAEADGARALAAVRRGAASAAAAAERHAAEAEALSGLAVTLRTLRRTRPLALADAVDASLFVREADAGARSGAARRRREAGMVDASAIDTAALAAYLTGAQCATDGPLAKRLRAALQAAADAALADAGRLQAVPRSRALALQAAALSGHAAAAQRTLALAERQAAARARRLAGWRSADRQAAAGTEAERERSYWLQADADCRAEHGSLSRLQAVARRAASVRLQRLA